MIKIWPSHIIWCVVDCIADPCRIYASNNLSWFLLFSLLLSFLVTHLKVLSSAKSSRCMVHHLDVIHTSTKTILSYKSNHHFEHEGRHADTKTRTYSRPASFPVKSAIWQCQRTQQIPLVPLCRRKVGLPSQYINKLHLLKFASHTIYGTSSILF